MRVRISFKVKNRGAVVPFHHQNLLEDLFKSLLKDGGYDKFHHFTDFTFSGIKGLTRVSRKGLHFHSKKVSIVISSTDDDFVHTIVSLLMDQSSLQFGNLQVEPEKVDQELMPELSDENKLVCISPIVLVLNESKQFIDPSSNEFSDLLFEAVANKMEMAGINVEAIEDFNKFQLVPDKEYLDKLKSNNKKFSRIYAVGGFDNEEIRGYTFPFKLYAPKQVQQFIFECGIGLLGEKGFGMIDIANQNPVERTVPYEVRSSISA